MASEERPMSISELEAKLGTLNGDLNEAERAGLKFLLGLSCAGLLTREQHGSATAPARDMVVSLLANLQSHRDWITPTGIAWRGRPSFITDEILRQMQEESAALRGHAERFDEYFVVPAGPTARAIAASDEFRELVSKHSGGPVVSTGKTNYAYYDEVGLGIDPHIDTDEYPINTILLLEHRFQAEPSHLVLYPKGLPPQRILLEPGEIVIFFADSVVHQRERMKEGEVLRIAAFGFDPITAGRQPKGRTSETPKEDANE
jgi:hypothetical protein